MIDLWPERLNDETVTAPVAILREQASLLGKKTKNLIKAEVDIGEQVGDKFLYHFYIIAPTLNNYHYRLFSVEYNISLYPLTIYVGDEMGAELDSIYGTNRKLKKTTDKNDDVSQYILTISVQEELVDVLKRILASKKTRQVIAALQSQVPGSKIAKAR